MFDFLKVVITVFSMAKSSVLKVLFFALLSLSVFGWGSKNDDFGPGSPGFSTDSNGSATKSYERSVNETPSRHSHENTGVSTNNNNNNSSERGSFGGWRDDGDDDNHNHNHHHNVSSQPAPFSNPPEPKVSFAGFRGLANAAKNIASIAKNAAQNISANISTAAAPHVDAYRSGVERAKANVGAPPRGGGSGDDRESKDHEDWADDYMREFYSGVAVAYGQKGLKPELQPVPSGPMHALTRNADIPKSADYHDPRHNQGLYSGTGARNLENRITDTIKSIDHHYRAGRIDLGVPGTGGINVNKTGVKGNLTEEFVQNLLDFEDPVQAFGIQNAVTVIGDVNAVEEINNNLNPTTVNVSRDIAGNVTNIEVNAHNFSVGNTGGTLGSRTRQTFGGVALGGIIAVPSMKAGQPIHPGTTLADIISHEAQHAGDLAIQHHAHSVMNDPSSTLEEKRQATSAFLAAGTVNSVKSALDYANVLENLQGRTRTIAERFKRSKNGYFNSLTEFRAWTKSQFPSKSHNYVDVATDTIVSEMIEEYEESSGEKVSDQMRSKLRDATRTEVKSLVETLKNSDTLNSLDDTLTDYAETQLSKGSEK